MFSFERGTVLDDKLSTNREVHTKSISASRINILSPFFFFFFFFFFQLFFSFFARQKNLGSNLKSPLILPVIKKLALVEKKEGGERSSLDSRLFNATTSSL